MADKLVRGALVKPSNGSIVKVKPHLEHLVKGLERTLAKLSNRREKRDKPWKMI